MRPAPVKAAQECRPIRHPAEFERSFKIFGQLCQEVSRRNLSGNFKTSSPIVYPWIELTFIWPYEAFWSYYKQLIITE